MVGAKMGGTPRIRMSSENTFAFSSTGNTSLTMAFGATMPTHPPSAWRNLNATNASTDVESEHPMDASMYNTRPIQSGVFLPNRSSSGPQMSWPAQMPIKQLDNE